MATKLRILLFLLLLALSTAARKGHLGPLGDSGTVTALPFELRGFPSPEVFLKDYVLKNKPLVMREAVLDMPATRLWSDAYLRAKTAAHDQQISVEHGKKETRKGGSRIKFSEFLKTYNNSDIYYVNAVPTVLSDDVIIPWPLQCKDYERSFEDNVMWFSSGGTKSVIHHDGVENVHCLLRGRKRFLFVNTTKYKDIESKIIDVEDRSYGSVDVDKVDLDKYPFYEGMEFFSVDMKAGDCVYSPQLWIHQVQSWDSNIAVNVWWISDINNLINISNCSREYDRTMTLNKIAFHKTTEIQNSANPDVVIHALRHGVARLVFTASGLKTVDRAQFMLILSGGAKLPARSVHIVNNLFRSMDANKNKQFEVTDLDVELSESAGRRLIDEGTEWLQEARLHEYPLPVDFSNDAYKKLPPFSLNEIAGAMDAEKSNGGVQYPLPNNSEDSDGSLPVNHELPIIDSDFGESQVPEDDQTIRSSVGERDEL